MEHGKSDTPQESHDTAGMGDEVTPNVLGGEVEESSGKIAENAHSLTSLPVLTAQPIEMPLEEGEHGWLTLAVPTGHTDHD